MCLEQNNANYFGKKKRNMRPFQPFHICIVTRKMIINKWIANPLLLDLTCFSFWSIHVAPSSPTLSTMGPSFPSFALIYKLHSFKNYSFKKGEHMLTVTISDTVSQLPPPHKHWTFYTEETGSWSPITGHSGMWIWSKDLVCSSMLFIFCPIFSVNVICMESNLKSVLDFVLFCIFELFTNINSLDL